jgi:hypothetical protein
MRTSNETADVTGILDINQTEHQSVWPVEQRRNFCRRPTGDGDNAGGRVDRTGGLEDVWCRLEDGNTTAGCLGRDGLMPFVSEKPFDLDATLDRFPNHVLAVEQNRPSLSTSGADLPAALHEGMPPTRNPQPVILDS